MIKIWGWEKKPRTMLRFLKSGDIFCFKYDDHTYCFGRIMSKVIFHIVEIFDYTSDQPIITEKDILRSGRLLVTPLDTYSLFDRKSEGRVAYHRPPEGLYSARRRSGILVFLGGLFCRSEVQPTKPDSVY